MKGDELKKYKTQIETQVENEIENLLNDFKVNDLNNILSEMIILKEQEFFDRLLKSYKNQKFNFKLIKITEKEMPLTSLFANAYFNLNYPSQNSPIDISKVNAMYQFIESKYSMDTGKSLSNQMVQTIDLNGLDKRITFCLDNFDKINELDKSFAEFFNDIKQVEWNDEKSKELLDRLKKIRVLLELHAANTPFIKREEDFLEYLAACSSVNKNRYNIEQEDVVKAYKTFLKLIKTNISNYNVNSSNKFKGALFCPKCGSFYELQQNEVHNGFVKECDCGSKLKYIEYIEEIHGKYVPNGVRILIISTAIILSFICSLYLVQFFNIDTTHFTTQEKKGLYMIICIPIMIISYLTIWLLFKLFGYHWKSEIN